MTQSYLWTKESLAKRVTHKDNESKKNIYFPISKLRMLIVEKRREFVKFNYKTHYVIHIFSFSWKDCTYLLLQPKTVSKRISHISNLFYLTLSSCFFFFVESKTVKHEMFLCAHSIYTCSYSLVFIQRTIFYCQVFVIYRADNTTKYLSPLNFVIFILKFIYTYEFPTLFFSISGTIGTIFFQ